MPFCAGSRCNNAEPSVGVGPAGIAALVTSDQDFGRTPTPDLSKLAIASSPNGNDWHIDPIGQLLPEQGLDVTGLVVLEHRILVVVNDRYPQPDGTNPTTVLVGQVD